MQKRNVLGRPATLKRRILKACAKPFIQTHLAKHLGLRDSTSVSKALVQLERDGLVQRTSFPSGLGRGRPTFLVVSRV